MPPSLKKQRKRAAGSAGAAARWGKQTTVERSRSSGSSGGSTSAQPADRDVDAPVATAAAAAAAAEPAAKRPRPVPPNAAAMQLRRVQLVAKLCQEFGTTQDELALHIEIHRLLGAVARDLERERQYNLAVKFQISSAVRAEREAGLGRAPLVQVAFAV